MTVDRETTEQAAAVGATPAHEPDAVAAGPVRIGIAILVIVLILGYLVPLGLETLFMDREARRSPPANPLAATEGARLPPVPRLQVNPARDIAELRRAENEMLESYGWVDQGKGIARIPIERAMAFVAERGLPAPPPAAAPAPVPAPAPSAGAAALPSHRTDAPRAGAAPHGEDEPQGGAAP